MLHASTLWALSCRPSQLAQAQHTLYGEEAKVVAFVIKSAESLLLCYGDFKEDVDAVTSRSCIGNAAVDDPLYVISDE